VDIFKSGFQFAPELLDRNYCVMLFFNPWLFGAVLTPNVILKGGRLMRLFLIRLALVLALIWAVALVVVIAIKET
jgi:hypothetical protein